MKPYLFGAVTLVVSLFIFRVIFGILGVAVLLFFGLSNWAEDITAFVQLATFVFSLFTALKVYYHFKKPSAVEAK